jgi:hypothetical protein
VKLRLLVGPSNLRAGAKNQSIVKIDLQFLASLVFADGFGDLSVEIGAAGRDHTC